MKNCRHGSMACPAGKKLAVALLAAASLLSALAGCSTQQVYQNLYQGIRVRNDLQTPPPERGARQESQDYWQYRNGLREGPDAR